MEAPFRARSESAVCLRWGIKHTSEEILLIKLALAVTDSGKSERFHPDLVYRVEPQRVGAVISVRGIGKAHVAEPFAKVRADLRAAKLQIAREPIYR